MRFTVDGPRPPRGGWRVRRLLCRLFGHRWETFPWNDNRVCRRCDACGKAGS